MKFYDIKPAMSKGAQYTIVYSERSDGKSYSALSYALERWSLYGEEFAIIRRNDEDFKEGRGMGMFDGIIRDGLVEKYTHGEFNTIVYRAHRWYFARWNEEKQTMLKDNKPFAFAFSLTAVIHDKSTSYPLTLCTIIFDEFLSDCGYLPNEFKRFVNTVSTIARFRANVRIIMLGNPVQGGLYCTYWEEFGIDDYIRTQKAGTIQVYTVGKKGLKICVEYSNTHARTGKPSDILFAFKRENTMITAGEWDMEIYPHLPIEGYSAKDVRLVYYIKYKTELLQCEIIKQGKAEFTFIHKKTTPIKNEEKAIVFDLKQNPYPNKYTKINRPIDKISALIAGYFKREEVYYSDNKTGEVVRSYLMDCGVARR